MEVVRQILCRELGLGHTVGAHGERAVKLTPDSLWSFRPPGSEYSIHTDGVLRLLVIE